MNNKKQLNPIYLNQKSFYNNATYTEDFDFLNMNTKKSVYTLTSYDSQVLKAIKYDFKDIDKQVIMFILNYDIKLTLLFSRTTLKHIKEFLNQIFNYDLKINKSFIEYYNEQFIFIDNDNVSSVFNNNELFRKLEYTRQLENL